MSTNPPGYLRAYYVKKKAELFSELGGRCVVCGTDYDLEIHHKNGWTGARGKNGRGRLDRLTDWERELSVGGLELLCDACHLAVTGAR